ncbi:uncharacterized protein A4U43_C10F17440 [Asparagus officinalis]|uniref:Uncharacterized protein n=1 Tax=Asparagus officinalis TaxID=4686 RepID=A0A5P1E3F2_ASPOF|nr:uncharacterized protein A4U43_C10F17440 [Asparagus officinalis]
MRRISSKLVPFSPLPHSNFPSLTPPPLHSAASTTIDYQMRSRRKNLRRRAATTVRNRSSLSAAAARSPDGKGGRRGVTAMRADRMSSTPERANSYPDETRGERRVEGKRRRREDDRLLRSLYE